MIRGILPVQRKKYLVIISFFYSILSFAQSDTLFFNADWKLCTKKTASYYRIAEPQIGGGYIIIDKYITTDLPQMIAYSNSIDPTYLHGKCTYYYPNGKKEAEGMYENNVRTGVWMRWSKDGRDSVKENYTKKGKKQNIITFGPFLYNKSRPFSIALRGKGASFFVIEDTYFMTFTLGTELKYKRHSIGIDATWFKWQYEHDNTNDVGMYSQYELRTYLLADYKLTFISFSRPQIDLYFNLYNKTGNYRMWYHKYDDYDFGNRDMSYLLSKNNGTFNEQGCGIGMRKYAERTGFGLDVSANYGLRSNDTNEYTVISETETDFKEHVKSQENLFYIRINCFYVFGRK